MDAFDSWNQQKKQLEELKKEILFREREIIFIKMGKNIGHEQDGKGESFLPPVVVIKKFNRNLFWGIPLTSRSLKNENPYYFYLGIIRKKENWAILSQGRCFDTKRIKHKLGLLEPSKFDDLKKAVQKTLFNI